MPDLSQIPVPLYTADQPYHWEYDNLPLQALSDRDAMINNQVDILSALILDSSGTQGTLSNRLAQSLDVNGNLIPAAIDEALHNIGKHTDGTVTVGGTELSGYVELGFPDLTNPVQFVRMLKSERDKLATVSTNATNLVLNVETISNIVAFDAGTIELAQSTSIHWEVTAPNIITPVLAVSTDFAHRHYYDMTPVMTPTADTIPVNYKLFKVTSMATPYIQGSLRVFVNGVRLSSQFSVYYPSNPVSTWTLNTYTENYASGLFTLATPILETDIIQIDFDVSLT